EEGTLGDRGRRLDFRDSVVVLTTTAAGEHLLERPTFVVGRLGADPDHGGLAERVRAELANVLRPELLARLGLGPFPGLTRDDLREVLDREVEEASRRLAEKEGLMLVVTAEARELLADQVAPSEQGAWPLRRAVERLLLEPLAEEMLRGRLRGNATITVGV